MNAGAFTHFDVTFYLQHDDGFTNHGAAHALLIGNKTLCRQLIAHQINALLDAIFQLGSKLLIKTTGFVDFHMRSRQGTADDLLYHFCPILTRFANEKSRPYRRLLHTL
jgi:hypothetical protein